MSARGKGELDPSPWYTRFADYRDRGISISFAFDDTTRALMDATVVREDECLFDRILIGVGEDGTPNSTPNVFVCGFGATVITAFTLAQHSLNTIFDVMTSLTAGRPPAV